MSTIENGIVKVDVGGKILEIEVRYGKFIKPKELFRANGYGSSLKPAHEPIAVFGKDAEPLDIPVPFFYGPKVATKERNLGCEDLFWLTDGGDAKPIERAEYERLAKENEENKGKEGFVPHKVAQGNLWPTVKSIELSRYLVRMVKMPGENLILDPFVGSGTTAIACILEGCNYVGIDKDSVAMRIAEARVGYFKKRMEKK
jgi:site-specific DNA-methyltransferase (adenine-specific)